MISRYFRRDSVIAAILFVLGLATRIPLHAGILYSWDSVDFALGIEHFNLQQDQPHPPGYILYMGLGHLVDLFIHNANASLVTISIICGSAAVAAIFLVGKSIFNRATGIVAAVLLLFSPMGWLYSDVALSYAVELLLAIVATWFLYQLFFYRRYAVPTAVIIGLAAGFRQDILLFLGPFWLIGVIRTGRRQFFWSLAAMCVAVMAWLLPLLSLAGGIAAYRHASSTQFSAGLGTASVFSDGLAGLTNNLQQAWIAIIWLFGLAVVMLAYLPLFFTSVNVRSNKRLLFLALLPLPAIVFFLAYYFRQPYLLTNSSPLILLMAYMLVENSHEAVAWIGSGATKWRWLALGGVLLVIAGVNTGLFITAAGIDTGIPGTGGTMGQVFGPYTVSGMYQANQKLDAIIGAVKRFSPGDTIVFATHDVDWRREMFYQPQYRTVLLNMDKGNGFSDAQNGIAGVFDSTVVPIPPRFREAVFIELDPAAVSAPLMSVPGNPTPVRITSMNLPPAGELKVGPYTLKRE